MEDPKAIFKKEKKRPPHLGVQVVKGPQKGSLGIGLGVQRMRALHNFAKSEVYIRGEAVNSRPQKPIPQPKRGNMPVNGQKKENEPDLLSSKEMVVPTLLKLGKYPRTKRGVSSSRRGADSMMDPKKKVKWAGAHYQQMAEAKASSAKNNFGKTKGTRVIHPGGVSNPKKDSPDLS